MTLIKLTLAAGALAAAAYPMAHVSAPMSQTGGVPLAPAVASVPQSASQRPPAEEELKDPLALEERFRMRLVAPDLNDREAAFDDMAAEAARNPNAAMALRAIAEDVGDPDLAFTARLALREAERALQPSAAPRYSRGSSMVPDPFEAIQKRMDELMGSDPFLRDFFADDPFAGDPLFGRSLRRGRSRLFGAGPRLFDGSTDPFDDLLERTEEIRRQLQALKNNPHELRRARSQAPSKVSASHMSIEKSAAGVRVEITEDEGSGPSTRVYEAPSMEALLEANPELKGRVR